MGALRQQKITPRPIPSRPSPLPAINMPKLEIIVSGGNFKRMDTKAYNITKKEAWVKLQVAGQEVTTTRVNCPMLDPVFDETFVLDINDPATDKATVTFYLADTLIGQPADYILSGLTKNRGTYKGMAIVGGNLDMTFRALDFGKEEEAQEEEDDGFMEFLKINFVTQSNGFRI